MMALSGSKLRGLTLALLPLVALTACKDGTGSATERREAVVVLNSVGLSLSVIPLGGAAPSTIGLGADGTPTTLAVNDTLAVVPMGITNVVNVVNLGTETVQTLALPAGSGATGVAFANDSIAVVANPERNTVSPVNVRRGTVGAEIAVGNYPQAVVADDDHVYVVNANLGDDFLPAGNGSVTVLDARTLAVVGTVALTGLNSGAAALRDDRLYVLNAGTWGGNNSSLSIVDVDARQQVARVDGFGNFPGSVTTERGRDVFVASYGTGLLVYDPETSAIVRGPGNPLVPNDLLPVSAVRFDPLGLLYTLHPGDCTAPGTVVQMDQSGTVLAQADVGVCPFAIDFGTLRVRS